MIFFDCAKFPFYFCLDHGKRLLFNVAIAAKGSAFDLWLLCKCLHLFTFVYPLWTAWSLFSAKKKISCNLSACPFVLHFHLVVERSAFFNDNAFLNFCLNSLHFLVDFLCLRLGLISERFLWPRASKFPSLRAFYLMRALHMVAGVLTLMKFPEFELPYAIRIDAATRQDPILVE
jgi:hypothetical protein